MHKGHARTHQDESIEANTVAEMFASILNPESHADNPYVLDEPLFTRPAYSLLKLSDGSRHWIMALQAGMKSGVVGIIAKDAETGLAYAISTHQDQILSIETYPEAMVEQLPPAQMPFGFHKQ